MYRLVAMAVVVMLLPLAEACSSVVASDIALTDPVTLGTMIGGPVNLVRRPSHDSGRYPLQVVFGIEHGQICSIVAEYDVDVPAKDLEAVLDKQYGPWRKQGSPIWRIEPERFAVILSPNTDLDGIYDVYYFAFVGTCPSAAARAPAP
jgi:hypothetical protein